MAKAGQALEEVSLVLGKAGVAGVGLTDEDMKKYNFGDISGITAYANAATKEDQIANDFGKSTESTPHSETCKGFYFFLGCSRNDIAEVSNTLSRNLEAGNSSSRI